MMILQRYDRKCTVFKVFIFINILVQINYWNWIAFKNLQWLSTQLVSFITVMESQFYITKHL